MCSKMTPRASDKLRYWRALTGARVCALALGLGLILLVPFRGWPLSVATSFTCETLFIGDISRTFENNFEKNYGVKFQPTTVLAENVPSSVLKSIRAANLEAELAFQRFLKRRKLKI